MRAFWLATVFLTSLAAADDTGVAPRAKPSDYPAHEKVKTTVLAAALVPPDQAKKMFSSEISKAYIVVEVAVYPGAGQSFDVDRLDFSLNSSDQVLHASNPRDVANPWQDKHAGIPSRGPNVSAETGVEVAHGTDPVTGRPRTSVATYEGVAVSNYPRPDDPAPPAPRGNSDQSAAQKVRDMALGQGLTSKPVAGYLYFRYSGKKRDGLTLNYSNDDLSVDLKLPK